MPGLMTNDPINSTQGHCSLYPSKPSVMEGSVYVEGFLVAKVNDNYIDHIDGCLFALKPDPHSVSVNVGSPDVFADGEAVHRVRDVLSCGDVASVGSTTVFANE